MPEPTNKQRLACVMISSPFPGTPTGALQIMLNITFSEKFLFVEAVRGSCRITVSGLWHVKQLVPLGKRNAMLMFAMRLEGSHLCCKCLLTE